MSNFYDCIAHNFAPLIDQDLNIPFSGNNFPFERKYKEMKFYRRTRDLGDFQSILIREDLGGFQSILIREKIKPLQKYSRGNRVAPSGRFMMIWILILYLKRIGDIGDEIKTSITGYNFKPVTMVFVG